ncbi:MAG: hypothetical protein ACOYK6_00440 [Chthoniobacterales bacterium]
MNRESSSSLAEQKPLQTGTATGVTLASIHVRHWQKNPFFPFLLSLLFHALLLLLFCCGLFRFATETLSISPSEAPTEALPEVVLDLSPPLPETRPTIQTASEQPLKEAPKDASFESHENTEASSELPSTGALPIPTQEGRESDVIELKHSESTARTKPLPTSAPAEEQQNDANKLTATALPSPKPIESTEKEHPVMGTLSSKAKGEESGSHPSMIRGAISNRGKSSVAAEATPIGLYKKTLADAISSHWYYCIDQRMELLSFGTATLFFYVNQQGKIEEPRIISNTSNQTFADCCLQSIIETKLPVIPPEIAKKLEKGRLEIEYRFTIYPD